MGPFILILVFSTGQPQAAIVQDEYGSLMPKVYATEKDCQAASLVWRSPASNLFSGEGLDRKQAISATYCMKVNKVE